MSLPLPYDILFYHIPHITSNQLVTCCEACGGDLGLSLYQIESGEHILCSSCYANTADRIHQQMNQEAKKGNGNVIGGIVGALLGALLSVVLWVLIYQLGYISALILLFAEQICLAIEIYDAFHSQFSITFFDAFTSVPAFLEDSEVLIPVAFELIMGYILMIVGAAGTVHATYKKNRSTVDSRMVTTITNSDNIQ